MTAPPQRRCLLITPTTFYTFHHRMAEGIARRGYTVDAINEEFPANSLGKVMGKLALPLLRRTTLRGLKARLDAVPPYDLIVIVKGRGLGPAALGYLRTRARRIVGYNFDSFGFNPSPRDWHALTDRYATFDIDDAASTGLPLVHLFSDAPMPAAPPEKRYQISIIQRVHSHRLAFAERVLDAMPPDWPHFVFLYESSYLTFLLGLLRHPRLYTRLWPYISFKPLPYAEAMAALAASRVTFDYAHPKQSGITVRCFEAQSQGVAILTNNQAAIASGVFEPGSIAHLPPQADAATIRSLVESLAQSSPAPTARTIDDFLAELIGG